MTLPRYWPTKKADEMLDKSRTSDQTRRLHAEELSDLAVLHAARWGADAALAALETARERVIEKTGGIV